MLLDEQDQPKTGSVELTEDTNPEVQKTAINAEKSTTIIKVVIGLICVFVGAFLVYRGVTTSDYSIDIQFGKSSVKFKDTPLGAVLFTLAILLLWRTKLDIKVKK